MRHEYPSYSRRLSSVPKIRICIFIRCKGDPPIHIYGFQLRLLSSLFSFNCSLSLYVYIFLKKFIFISKPFLWTYITSACCRLVHNQITKAKNPNHNILRLANYIVTDGSFPFFKKNYS